MFNVLLSRGQVPLFVPTTGPPTPKKEKGKDKYRIVP